MSRKRTGQICPKCKKPCYFEEKPTRNNKKGDKRYRYYRYAVHYNSITGKRTSCSINKFVNRKQTSDILDENGDFIDLCQKISNEDFNECLYLHRRSQEIIARNKKEKTLTRERISDEDLKELLNLDDRKKKFIAKFKRNQKTLTNPWKPITNERLKQLLDSPNDAVPIIAQYGLNHEQIGLLSVAEKKRYLEENKKISRQVSRHINQDRHDIIEKAKRAGYDRGGLR